MVRITGDRAHSARLRRIAGPAMIGRVGRALFAGGERIQVRAQILISDGAVSGAGHVPSVSPNPPNYDTGVLANNIETTQEGPLLVHVSSNAPYSVELEKGTSKMGERPFMGPAAQMEKPGVIQLVRGAVSAAVRGA